MEPSAYSGSSSRALRGAGDAPGKQVLPTREPVGLRAKAAGSCLSYLLGGIVLLGLISQLARYSRRASSGDCGGRIRVVSHRCASISGDHCSGDLTADGDQAALGLVREHEGFLRPAAVPVLLAWLALGAWGLAVSLTIVCAAAARRTPSPAC